MIRKISKLKKNMYEVPVSYEMRSYTEGKKIGFPDAIAALYCLLKYWIIMLRYLRNTFLEKYIKSNLFLLLFSDKIIENFKFLLPYENDWLFFKNYKINKKSIIIDIGAHWGESAITFRKFYPDNKIVSFEPNKDVFKKLKKKY
mgnify:CR=1 FL=1